MSKYVDIYAYMMYNHNRRQNSLHRKEVIHLNGAMLNEKIEAAKLTRNAIADSLGITRQGLYNKLAGQNEFKESEIKRLIELLDLTEQEQRAIFFTNDVGEYDNTIAE